MKLSVLSDLTPGDVFWHEKKRACLVTYVSETELRFIPLTYRQGHGLNIVFSSSPDWSAEVEFVNKYMFEHYMLLMSANMAEGFYEEAMTLLGELVSLELCTPDENGFCAVHDPEGHVKLKDCPHRRALKMLESPSGFSFSSTAPT